MKKLQGYLQYQHRIALSRISKECVSAEELCDYAEGGLALERRERIERHAAQCYHCLNALVSIHDGMRRFAKMKGAIVKMEYIFLLLAMISFVLSFIFKRYFLQFLAAAIILGIKWIVDSKSTRMLITVYDALRKRDDPGPTRDLKDRKEAKEKRF